MTDKEQRWMYPDRSELKDGPAQIKRGPGSDWQDVVICGNGRMFQPVALPDSVFWDMTNVMFAYSVRVLLEEGQKEDGRSERDLRPDGIIEYLRKKNEAFAQELQKRSCLSLIMIDPPAPNN